MRWLFSWVGIWVGWWRLEWLGGEARNGQVGGWRIQAATKLLTHSPHHRNRAPQGDEHKIQDALRVVASAMEGGHWDVLNAILNAHQSDMLGPYFLPAIAQQGRVSDLAKMVEAIEAIGCSDADYLGRQISSAMVSAALSGQEEMLVALESVRGKFGVEKEGGEKKEGGGSDRSEL